MLHAMHHLIITAIGPDHPGLVGDFTRHVYEVGASLADSRMVNLRGQFALLALIEGSPDSLAALRRVLEASKDALGLHLDMREVDVSTGPAPGSVPYRLKVYSPDQPGIVARVTDLLRQHAVNVEELETRVESAPFAGTLLFLLEAVLSLPKGTSVRKLREELQALGDRIGCDIDLDPV